MSTISQGELVDTYDDRGWVRPVPGDADTAHMDPIEPARSGSRSSLVTGLILVVLIVAAVAATVAWRGRNGDPFASARSVPADMDYVLTFDALALSDSERLQAFVDAFAIPMVDAELIDDYPTDLVAAIDETMGDEIGFTLTDDLLPWVGRSISLAGTVPELDDPLGYGVMPTFSFILSADVRDSAAAEAFVDKVIVEVADDISVTSTEIAGYAGYRFAATDDAQVIALVLTGDVLLVGIEDDVVSAIEAKDAGLSIADDAGFRDTMSQLPAERMMSLYVAPSALDAVVDLGAMGMPAEAIDTSDSLGMTGVATAASLVDEGLLLSYVVSGGVDTVGALVPDNSVLASLPQDTLGFMSVAGIASSEGMVIDDGALADLGYPLDELSEELGIDIVGLIESLSGDLTFAATETRNSSIADATDVPVGVVGAIGLTDSGPILDLIGMLEEMITEQGFDLNGTGDVITVAADGQEFASYSVQNDLLVIGTSEQLVEDLVVGSEGGLLSSDLYLELDQSVVGDGLVMFVDVDSIVDLVPMTSDEAAIFAPMRGMGLGGAASGDSFLMEVLFLIDY